MGEHRKEMRVKNCIQFHMDLCYNGSVKSCRKETLPLGKVCGFATEFDNSIGLGKFTEGQLFCV